MTIKVRQDTDKIFKEVNPVLGYRELCCVHTKRGRRWKIGDGTTPFNDLKYVTRIRDIESFIVYAERPVLVEEPTKISMAVVELYNPPTTEG